VSTLKPTLHITRALEKEAPFLMNKFKGERKKIAEDMYIYVITAHISVSQNYSSTRYKPQTSRNPIIVREGENYYVNVQGLAKGTHNSRIIRRVTRYLRNKNIEYRIINKDDMKLLAKKGVTALIQKRMIKQDDNDEHATKSNFS